MYIEKLRLANTLLVEVMGGPDAVSKAMAPHRDKIVAALIAMAEAANTLREQTER